MEISQATMLEWCVVPLCAATLLWLWRHLVMRVSPDVRRWASVPPEPAVLRSLPELAVPRSLPEPAVPRSLPDASSEVRTPTQAEVLSGHFFEIRGVRR